MKKLLLVSGLLAVAGLDATPVLAQGWAGILPVDSASGKIVYQGNVEMPGVPATVLRKRATFYVYQWREVRDTTWLTRLVFVVGRPADLSCQVRIAVVNNQYHYTLFAFAYNQRGGEAFGPRGNIISRSPNTHIAAEKQLQTIKSPTDLQAWQEGLAQTAQKIIAELQHAMQ